MMGRPHALSGGAAWMVTAPVFAYTANSVPWLPDFTLSPATYALGIIATTGAALAPDLDHGERSYAMGSLGAATKGLGKILGTFGHRTLTHSWLGIIAAVAVLVSLGAVSGPLGSIYPALIMFLMTAFGMSALYSSYGTARAKRITIRIAVSAAIAGAAYYFSAGDWGWLVIAFALGLIIHVLGDSITVAGVPWLWPVGRVYRMSPALFLLIFAAPTVFILYSITPALALVTSGVIGVLALLMLKPFNAGGMPERYILTPVFIATALIAALSIAITVASDSGGPNIGGFSITSTPEKPGPGGRYG